MKKSISLYCDHRFPAAVISCTVRRYCRFHLNLRDIEELVSERVAVSHTRRGVTLGRQDRPLVRQVRRGRCPLSETAERKFVGLTHEAIKERVGKRRILRPGVQASEWQAASGRQ
jgi:hypothetical protein